MPNEQDRIKALENDVIDLKIRMGVAESDLRVVKDKLTNIDRGVSKLLWGVFGTFGTMIAGVVVTILNYALSHH